MSRLSNEAPLAVDQPDLVHRVREVLDRIGFDEKHIYERFGAGEQGQLTLGPLDRPRLLWRTRDNDQLSALLRLFLVEVPVELDDFRRAIAPMDPADWANLGLVMLDGTTVRGAVTLRASGKLVIAHDCSMPAKGKRPDYVLGVTGATLTIAGLTVRPPSRRTLDLGTGSGFHALTASTHSEQVVGTDRNSRAIAIARFNALLNGITNVEFVTGDLFEPVSDLQFDLIVSNPPFVISPENQLQYRDSGYRGDEICERIVRAGPEHLAEGGYLQVLCNWVRDPGEGWRERLLGWIDGSGCDAQIIHNSTSTIDVYANQWLRQTEISTEDRFAEAFHRWIAYYEQLGIEAVDLGLITLRRRSGCTNWVRFETDRRRNHPNGAGILATFAARDLLDRIGENTSGSARTEASLQAGVASAPAPGTRRLWLGGRERPVLAGQGPGIRGAAGSGDVSCAHALPGPATPVRCPGPGGGPDRTESRPDRAGMPRHGEKPDRPGLPLARR